MIAHLNYLSKAIAPASKHVSKKGAAYPVTFCGERPCGPSHQRCHRALKLVLSFK